MQIDILTCQPDVFSSPLETCILKRAQQKKLVTINIHNLRDFSADKHRKTDDYPYGGGSGMVMMAQPFADCIEQLQEKQQYDEIIFLTPDGELFTQTIANELSLKPALMILAGRYKGIDQRIRDNYVTREISIGDYVLSGGELPAIVVIDTLVRLLPGALGDEVSALSDSFQTNLLDPPHYTRPENFRGWKVPPVLLSGNTAKIEAWRDTQALEKTQKRRPDLLKKEEN
ncbi:MAG: tRNA (guanosine(37)-N1)-methyltransferase TrmD [Bacteroidia bacterium]|nr:tRNA (guanosine(37)-N1)-methyltransferase TrmD [Bacteroidia bacterium]